MPHEAPFFSGLAATCSPSCPKGPVCWPHSVLWHFRPFCHTGILCPRSVVTSPCHRHDCPSASWPLTHNSRSIYSWNCRSMLKLAQANPAENLLSVEPLRATARSHPGFLCQAPPISRLPTPSKTPESILSLPGLSDSPLAACPLPSESSHSQGSLVLVGSQPLG